MRSINFINRLIEEGALRDDRFKHVLLHRIDGGAEMAVYPASSRNSTDAAMIGKLFDLGRASAAQWLDQHFAALGQHGTVDIRRDYLDDTREQGIWAAGARQRERGFRAWLTRLFRRFRRADRRRN
jgi:NTE family protein